MTFKHTFKSGKVATIEVNEICDQREAAIDVVLQMTCLREQHDHLELNAWFDEVMEWCEKNLINYH